MIKTGKNDGSVAGIRYFQCEKGKGIFSRLTRLTRSPLISPDGCDASIVTSPTNGSVSPPSMSSSVSHSLTSPTNNTKNLSSFTSHASHTGKF